MRRYLSKASAATTVAAGSLSDGTPSAEKESPSTPPAKSSQSWRGWLSDAHERLKDSPKDVQRATAATTEVAGSLSDGTSSAEKESPSTPTANSSQSWRGWLSETHDRLKDSPMDVQSPVGEQPAPVEEVTQLKGGLAVAEATATETETVAAAVDVEVRGEELAAELRERMAVAAARTEGAA